jgi:hypothetical protein
MRNWWIAPMATMTSWIFVPSCDRARNAWISFNACLNICLFSIFYVSRWVRCMKSIRFF